VSDKNPFKPASGILGIFVVAVLVAAIGVYTKNDGFFVAGMIFLVVSIVLWINQSKSKK
jgi:energy-converting hydrogenase Eha subunit B